MADLKQEEAEETALGELGPAVPSGASVLAAKMGKSVALLTLSGRYP